MSTVGPGAGWLRLAGGLSLGVALFHLVVIAVGAPAYRYFGAGEEMARAAAAGSPMPGLVTLAIALLFATWSLYAFSGAGRWRRLPMLRAALVMIGGIYVLRGLFVVPETIGLVLGRATGRQLIFSAVALAIGAVHVWGTALSWKRLSQPRPDP